VWWLPFAVVLNKYERNLIVPLEGDLRRYSLIDRTAVEGNGVTCGVLGRDLFDWRFPLPHDRVWYLFTGSVRGVEVEIISREFYSFTRKTA